MLSLVLAVATVPTRAHAAAGWIYVKGTITWHGGDPSPVAFLVNTRDAIGYYHNAEILYGYGQYNWPAANEPQLYLSPTTYKGNGEWTLSYVAQIYDGYGDLGSPFVGLSQSSLDGKWYCDKWDYNNVIYQPGQYGTYQGICNDFAWEGSLYKADFFLTNSESATKTITVNRTWSGGVPAVDSTLSLYRYYSQSGQYEFLKSVDMPGIANGVTFNTLYSGKYAVVQSLPSHYYNDAAASGTGIGGYCYQADLTSNSSAAVSLTDSREQLKTVSVAQMTGGTVTPDATQVFAYDTVSLTVTPGANMRLKPGTLKYTSDWGDYPISGTSFMMPNSDVTISAEFEGKRTVSVAQLTGGTVTPNVTKTFPGDTVSLLITPDVNKQLKSGTLKYTDSSGDHTITGTSFAMPQGDVTISASFEPKQYAIGVTASTGGSITPDKTAARSGEMVNLTVNPSAGMHLKPGTLQYTYGSHTVPITGTSFAMPQSDVTISAQFEIPVSIVTTSLPEGMQGNAYSASVLAQNGTPNYTWSAEGLPDGLLISQSTGAITGIPAQAGSFDVVLTATDALGTLAHKTVNLHINERCGNGAYLITPDASANYSWAYADGGLPAMTVKSGVSGFTDFSVSITPENGHAGKEVLLFVQTRGGVQIGIGYVKADFDVVDSAGAAFNVKPGDVVKAYVVDGLNSSVGQNPNIL